MAFFALAHTHVGCGVDCEAERIMSDFQSARLHVVLFAGGVNHNTFYIAGELAEYLVLQEENFVDSFMESCYFA